jgi:hypothetical protein
MLELRVIIEFVLITGQYRVMIISGGLLCLTTLSTIFQIYHGGVMIINFVFVNEPGMHFVFVSEPGMNFVFVSEPGMNLYFCI